MKFLMVGDIVGEPGRKMSLNLQEKRKMIMTL